MAKTIGEDPNDSIRRLTQREKPPTEHECIQIRNQVVRRHVECLGAIDLFHDFLCHHGHSKLTEEAAFQEALQASKRISDQQRLHAAIQIAWGEDEADHILRRQQVNGPTSLTVLTTIKTIAGRMTLARFKSLANALMLVRHRLAVTNLDSGRSTSIAAMPRSLDKELRLIRDCSDSIISYCDVQVDDAVRRDVVAWTKDTDGSVIVGGKPLSAWFHNSKAREYHMVQLDDRGWLVRRTPTPQTPSPLFATPPSSSSYPSANGDLPPQLTLSSLVPDSIDLGHDAYTSEASSPGTSRHETENEASQKQSRSVSESITGTPTPTNSVFHPFVNDSYNAPPLEASESGRQMFGMMPENSPSGQVAACEPPSTARLSEASTVVESPPTNESKALLFDFTMQSPYTGADVASVHLSEDASSDAGLEAEAEFGGATSSDSDMPPTPCDGYRSTDDHRDSPADKPALSLTYIRRCAASQVSKNCKLIYSLMKASALYDSFAPAAIALKLGRLPVQNELDWMSKVRSGWFSQNTLAQGSRLHARRARKTAEPQSPGSPVDSACFTKDEMTKLMNSSHTLITVAFVVGPQQRNSDLHDCFEGLLGRLKELDATSVPVLHGSVSTPKDTRVGEMIRGITGDKPLLAMQVGEEMADVAPMNLPRRFRLLESLMRRSCNHQDCEYLQQSSYVCSALSTGHIANLGACSGAQIDVLGGTWVKISLGVVVLATVPGRHNLGQLREISAKGRLWSPQIPPPAVIMRPGDTAYLPAGTIYSIAAVDKCHISYRVVWDDEDIVRSLATISKLNEAEIVRLINMGICPDLPTSELLREMKSNCGRFGDRIEEEAARRVLEILDNASDTKSRASKRPRTAL